MSKAISLIGNNKQNSKITIALGITFCLVSKQDLLQPYNSSTKILRPTEDVKIFVNKALLGVLLRDLLSC